MNDDTRKVLSALLELPRLEQFQLVSQVMTVADGPQVGGGEQALLGEIDNLRNELEDQRKATAEILERHEREFGDLALQRDEAGLAADELAGEREEARDTIEDLQRKLNEERDHADRLDKDRKKRAISAEFKLDELTEEHRDERDTMIGRHERELSQLARERDGAKAGARSAAEAFDDLQQRATQRREAAELRLHELSAELTTTKADVDGLVGELQDATQSADQTEAGLEEDHHRTLAQMLETHEQQIAQVAGQRDGAIEEAERMAEALEAERKELDERFDAVRTEAENEVERLIAERDGAQDQAAALDERATAAQRELTRLDEEHSNTQADSRLKAAALTDSSDKFIVELLEGHEKELLALSKQRDEARTQATTVADEVAQAKLDTIRLTKSLEEERSKAARLASEREAAALKLDRMAEEREASTRRAAEVMAGSDKFVAELLEGHERELDSARRQRAFAKQQSADAVRQLAEMKVTLMRLKTLQSGTADLEV
jgi:hypothetical protein